MNAEQLTNVPLDVLSEFVQLSTSPRVMENPTPVTSYGPGEVELHDVISLPTSKNKLKKERLSELIDKELASVQPGPNGEQCHGKEDYFFKLDGERESAKYRYAVAKALCVSCPIVSACLEGALQRREDFGFWGGHDEDSRRALLRKRK